MSQLQRHARHPLKNSICAERTVCSKEGIPASVHFHCVEGEESPSLRSTYCSEKEVCDLVPLSGKPEVYGLEPVHVKEETPELSTAKIKEEVFDLDPGHVRVSELDSIHIKKEVCDLESLYIKDGVLERLPMSCEERVHSIQTTKPRSDACKMTERKRERKFAEEEINILVSEVTRNEHQLFGRGRIGLTQQERDRIWEAISHKMEAITKVPRTVKQLKRRWDDLKRRQQEKLAFLKRSLSEDSSGEDWPSVRRHRRETGLILVEGKEGVAVGFPYPAVPEHVIEGPSRPPPTPPTISPEDWEIRSPPEPSEDTSGEDGGRGLPCPSARTSLTLFERCLLDAHIQQTQVLNRVFQELVEAENRVASSMERISEQLQGFHHQMGTMVQTLSIIKEDIHAVRAGLGQNTVQQFTTRPSGSSGQ
ncbi:myb-related transcription factor, partner of profilin-like [Protopterus annectens]|uniref:myb-related transcription factor, partner of profilin-like n=1 Tax=Protopterus annectens TaxID=7888 RepID=UPI001CF9B095|nr:myb-related transcription factor, partner of profilin-like [Protopterus annectens]